MVYYKYKKEEYYINIYFIYIIYFNYKKLNYKL